MCHGDGKMRWQIGGNVEPVKTICELNWHECPGAIFNYIWSEIVTDVVECLSSETMLWRILATFVVCTLVAHTVYYKIRWMDETALNRENLNRVGFKVQDLELKVNILTYKMQYGAWPLPRDFNGTEFEENELHKLKLTLSNSKQRNGWIKHLLLSPKQNGRSFMPHSNSGSKSVECLTRIIDLEAKYVPSQFYQDTSPGGSNMARTSSSAILSEKLTRHTKVSNVESKNKFLSHRDASKNENVIVRNREIEKTKLTTKKWPRSDGDVNNEAYASNLQTVSHGKSKKPFEKLIRVADECQKFMKDVKTGNKSFRLIDSLSSESKNQNRPISQTGKIIEKEAAGDRHKITNEGEREGGTQIEEDKLHEKSFEDYSNASNFVALLNSHEEIKTSFPSVSKSDVGHDLKNTVDTNKSKLLPPSLSITLKMTSNPKQLSETKTETALEIDEGLKNKIVHSKCEPTNTNAILHGVKDKLENLHKVLRSYDAQDDSKAGHQSKVKTLQLISRVNDVMESKVAVDLLNSEKNENMNKTSSENTNKFSVKDETSSSNEKYDTNETTRSSDSSVHNERRLNIFNMDVTSADENSQKLEKNISNEGWTYEKAKTTKMKNNCDDEKNNENKIIGSDRTINESEMKIRNFYCLTRISNNASSASSRESISGSARNDILVSEKFSGNRSEYENQVDWSSNVEEEINPKRNTTLEDKDEIYSIKMETEEDTTMISQTSSQTEISNSSDLELESKTTVQLLQEALVFKKVLLSQMEMEKSTENLKDEKQMNNEENNNASPTDELSWNKNENYFQLKLLDIISEEQSASSSTEKTAKNSNKNCIKNRLQNDSKILTTYPSNDNRCEKSKDVLATGSCEYFSLTDMQNSSKNLEKSIQNEDSVFSSKIGIKSKVEIKKINDTEKTDGSLKKTTYTINTLPVKNLNNIKKDSQDNNDAILNKNKVTDRAYRTEEKNLLINNVNQLYVQNKQHAQNHNKVSLQSRNKAIEATQEAMRQREEDENLNMVQAPFDCKSWNPTRESSSHEGVKEFISPLPDTKTKSLNNTGGTKNLKCPRSSGHNFSRNSNILSLQRRPGIYSLPDSKTLKIEENLASFDNNERSIDACTLQQCISTKENNLDTKCNIQSYSLNEALDEDAMNIVTLDKRNKNDENSLVTNEAQENNSPLTGRTVVLPMNNMFIDDSEETVERIIEIMPQMDVTQDLISLENTAPDLHSVKDEMGTAMSEGKRYNDCSGLELSINEDCSKRDEERFDNAVPTVNQEQILRNSMSNINSQPSSLYFTDEVSLSEIKLNSVGFPNLDVASARSLKTKKNVEKDNTLDIKNETTALNKSMCIINELHDAEVLHDKPVADDVNNTESINLKNNEITQELDTEVLLNTNTLTENKEGNEHKIHELNMKMTTALTNKSNTDDVTETTDASNKNENGHMCTAEKNSDNEKLVLEPLISIANLNSDTSNSIISTSTQDVGSNSINVTLDRPILSRAINKSDISPVNKSTRCSSASQLSRLPWSTRTTPLSSASSLKSKILEKPLLSKPEVIHSRQKMKCKSMDLKIARNDNQQLSARSHVSLRLDGPPAKHLSSQSGIEIPQRRSRSSVTPRKSQISPRDDNVDDFDNKGNQTSRSRDYTPRMAKKNVEGNVTTPKSKLKTTTKTISKSCIPILKSRLETEKKLEPELRSKSPARGPMTITNSQVGEAPCCTQIEVMSDLLEGDICQSQCLTEKEIEDHNESGDIINVLELQDISEQYAHLKQINIPNDSYVGDSDRSIIYMNIVADHDHDHTAIAVVDPKRFIECIEDSELKVENIDKDKINENYESEKPTSINTDEQVSPILTTALTVIDDNLLNDTREKISSKIVITDETKDSCCIEVEHKEIEVSVKPSVTDISTSISDLPNISREPKNLMEAFKIFEVPKELTKEEYIILLETLNQDPNLVQFRRMQKLCSKLGLGFRE
ncbi:protein PF14_0175 isoform X2 [Cephus cinctus]|uniref:Protein PF14_0175 isoform X2 n=1 Tax=Cephus cinctus TaxID=211228 RepID=A0AAJ7RN01_CEPCN|nr:protein PF14_0175 isoform X2 [Cephus cinctus]